MLKREPNALFVFGDNLQRKGLGGQAKEMRGEPNAVGIPTKRSPGMEPQDFLYECDLAEWCHAVDLNMSRLIHWQELIVWPTAGIGTGLAQLHQHAPSISRELDIFKTILITEPFDFSRISRFYAESNCYDLY